MDSQIFIYDLTTFKCPLTKTILELASQPDIDDFQKFKDLITASNLNTIKKILISVVRKGIIRNVEYIITYSKNYGLVINDVLYDAIYIAIVYHHNQIINYIMDNFLDIIIEHDKDDYLLSEAISAENCVAIKFLLQRGTKIINPKLLIQCCYTLDELEIIEMLFRTNINFNEHINEAFSAAAMKCHIITMNYLLKKGVDVAYQNNIAIKHAIAANDTSVAELLLKNGVDVNIENSSLLLLCFKSGDNYQMLELLIKYGIDVLRHYGTVYNYCLEHQYMKSASILVRFSYLVPLTINEQKKLKISDEFEEIESDLN